MFVPHYLKKGEIMTSPTGNNLSCNTQIKEGELLQQNICRIYVPEDGSAKIEAYVQSKGLNEISDLPGKINWAYFAARPLLYIEVPNPLTTEELNSIELKIRNKGIETFGGGLADSRAFSLFPT